MYQALENAAQATGKEVCLSNAAGTLMSTLKKPLLPVRSWLARPFEWSRLMAELQKIRETAWASADVFCSLSDNIQETFGIVPIEAMAAGSQ